MRLRTILLATTLCFIFSSAFAQAGAPNAAAPQAKPAKRAVASFWTSPEPTFDEGTYNQ